MFGQCHLDNDEWDAAFSSQELLDKQRDGYTHVGNKPRAFPDRLAPFFGQSSQLKCSMWDVAAKPQSWEGSSRMGGMYSTFVFPPLLSRKKKDVKVEVGVRRAADSWCWP